METVATSHIAIDPAIRRGRPHLASSRITVADVVLMHLRLGQSLEEIAGKHDLPLAALYAAMAYYHDHRGEIDRAIEDDDAFVQAFRRNNPSPLREKLASLARGE
jgi:uncharacterized protein (DUF433 family)